MKCLFFGVIGLFFLTFTEAQETSYQGKVDFVHQIRDFETSPGVPGTLYLLTGAAGLVKILQTDPFQAEVEFVQADWQGEDSLVAHRVILRFKGEGFKENVSEKKPRKDSGKILYPYKKFQVAAVPDGQSSLLGSPIPVFRVLHLQILE